MAKDPAFLWYPGDYIAGTTEYTFEEKGAYVEILMKQFEHGGPLPEEKIKRILREKFSAIWPVICEKFKQDEHGNFYNDRLEKEREKRKNFTQSRRDNLKGKNKTHKESHMEQHTEDRMENENENENRNENKIPLKEKELKKAPRGTIDDQLHTALDEIYIEQQRMKWREVDFDLELFAFVEKVRGSPERYAQHDTPGLRLAFQAQLRNAKKKHNGKSYNKNDRTEFNEVERAIIAAHASSGGSA